MKKLMLLLTITLFCFNAEGAYGQDWTALEDFDFVKLEGKWIVVSVEFDGDQSKAQIGQRCGDVIILSSDLNVGLPQID